MDFGIVPLDAYPGISPSARRTARNRDLFLIIQDATASEEVRDTILRKFQDYPHQYDRVAVKQAKNLSDIRTRFFAHTSEAFTFFLEEILENDLSAVFEKTRPLPPRKRRRLDSRRYVTSAGDVGAVHSSDDEDVPYCLSGEQPASDDEEDEEEASDALVSLMTSAAAAAAAAPAPALPIGAVGTGRDSPAVEQVTTLLQSSELDSCSSAPAADHPPVRASTSAAGSDGPQQQPDSGLPFEIHPWYERAYIQPMKFSNSMAAAAASCSAPLSSSAPVPAASSLSPSSSSSSSSSSTSSAPARVRLDLTDDVDTTSRSAPTLPPRPTATLAPATYKRPTPLPSRVASPPAAAQRASQASVGAVALPRNGVQPMRQIVSVPAPANRPQQQQPPQPLRTPTTSALQKPVAKKPLPVEKRGMTKAQEKKVAAVARAKEAELLLAGARATKDYATFFANSSVNVVEAVRGQYWDNDLPLGMDFSKVSSHQLMVIRTYLLAQMKQAKQVEDLVTREMKRRSFPFIAVVRTTRQKLSPSAVKSLSEFHGINVVYDVSDDVLIDKKINDVIMNELLNTYVALHRTVHTVARDLANPQFMVNLMSQDPTDRPLGAPELPLVIPYLSEPAPFFALVLKNPSELAAFSIVPFDKLSTTDAAAVKL